MILNHILRSPAAVEGTTEAKSAEDLQLGMGEWVEALPNLENDGPIQPNEPPPPQRKKESDGTTTPQPTGDRGTGLPGAAKPASESAGQPADAAQKQRLADESAKAAAADKAKAEAEAAAAKAAEEAKKAEEAAKKVEPGQEKWPRNSSDWDKYKKVHADKEAKLQAEIDAREAKLKDMETQLKTVQETAAKAGEASPEVTSKLQRLEKENEEMSKRLQVLDVTQHPKFQAYFENKVAAQKELGKRIVGAEKGPAFEKLLALPDSDYKNQQIEEFVSDLPILQQSRIGAVLNALEGINQEKTAEIAKAGEHRTQLTEEQKVKQAQNAAAKERVINEVTAQITSEKDGMAIFQKRADDVAWNQAVDERIATAKKLLSGQGLKPADIVRAAFHATAVPAILQAYQNDMKESQETITKLEEQVKALTAAQPGAGKGGTGSAANGDTTPRADLKAGMNPMEATNAWTKNLPGWGES
jgi:hypothetical protein